MEKTSRKRVWGTLATIAAGTGLSVWFSIANDYQHEPIKVLQGPAPAASIPAITATAPTTSFNVAKQESAQMANPHLTATEKPAENVPNATLLARYFYAQFLQAKTAEEKMDNLRWSISEYGRDLSPDMLQKAANGLGLKKEDLIKTIRETALTFFRENTASSKASNYGQMTYWNDLSLAYKFAGIDNDGHYSESLAIAYTGYTYDVIAANRANFIVSGIQETLPQILGTLENIINTDPTQPKKNKRISLYAHIDDMPLATVRDLSDKLSFINHALDKGLAKQLESMGLKPTIAEELYGIENALGTRINRDYLELANKQSEKNAPAPRPAP